jgi:nucleotide-binding universal stress UspA family protein
VVGAVSIRWDPCVVVGVDRSLHGLAALRVAVVEAARRGVPLHAVRVQTALPSPAAFEEIDEAFAEALGGVPQAIELHRELMFPPVAAALARRAGGERDLLVVGESGRGAWHTLLSGSVSRSCLRRAHCPVMAVPVPEMACVPRRRRPWRRRSDDLWQGFEEGRSSPHD